MAALGVAILILWSSIKHSARATAWDGISSKNVAGVAAVRALPGADSTIRLSLAYSRRKTLAVRNTPCSRATTAAEAHNPAGVGKTTLAIHLAAAFVAGGYDTALLDLDPQASSV
jgi:Mrp family chromosome partitioning ATPase